MGAILHYLLSARFILTIGHLITILMVLITLSSNISASFGDNASQKEINDATSSAQVFIFENIVLINCSEYDVGCPYYWSDLHIC